MFSGIELERRITNSNDTVQCQLKLKNSFMHMAGGIPVTDPAGFPLYKVVTRGREYLPAPWNIRDTKAPKKSYYDRIIENILDSNARSQA